MLNTDISKRLYGLDILRSVAILQVLLGHTMLYIPQVVHPYIYPFLLDGVGIFFVLSGFLIGGILIKTINKEVFNSRSLLRFWVNRWMRTLAPYYIVLILVYIVSLIPGSAYDSSFIGLKTKISYLFFLQNFNWDSSGFFGESWSLAVEEWFYLLVPLILFVLYWAYKQNQKKSVFATILVVIIVVPLFRLYKYIDLKEFADNQGIYYQLFRYQVLSRLDCIVYGILGSYLAYYHKNIWSKNKVLFLILGLLVLVIYKSIDENLYKIEYSSLYNLIYNVFYFPIFSIGILLTIPFLSLMKSRANVLCKLFTYISLISYSLYLLHQNVKHMIVESLSGYFGIDNGLVKLVSVWVLTIFLSTLMYLYIEKPFMDMRKKIKI